MSRLTAKVCRVSGCPEIAVRGNKCPAHAAAYDRGRMQTADGELTSRGASNSADVRKRRKLFLDAQYRKFGDTAARTYPCPGFGVELHTVTYSDLTVEDIVSVAAGGTSVPSNWRVLCRSCNSRRSGGQMERNPDGSYVYPR